MNIKVGKYILCSDRYCMWILEESISESGKTTTKRVAGYSTSVKNLLEDYTRKKMRESDAESLEELLVAVSSAQDDVSAFIDAIVEQGYKVIEDKAKDVFILGSRK